MKNFSVKLLVLVFLCFSVFLFSYFSTAKSALAVEFDSDYLISDSEMTNYQSLNQKEIQNFLNRRQGTLKNYISIDKEGKFKTASQAFYEVSQKWMINPKYLMILTQKEMSLLTDKSPKQTQYDWATGYGCFDNQSCNTKYKGFYKQINSAAAQTRYYMDNIHEFNYQPSKTYHIDNIAVTPKNTATAGLYNYTPHIHGNELFWDLWNKYFGKKWPDGALLQATSTGKTYFITNGKKREIMSKAVLLSYFNPNKIIKVSQSDINYYDNGVPIKYLNFALVSTLATGHASTSPIYMIVDDKKRQFENFALFSSIGFQEDEIIKISQSDLNLYKNGAKISKYSLYPAGILLQDEKTNKIYYVLNGRKKIVVNDEILNSRFQSMPIKTASTKELDKYRSGNPVTLPEGELIKVRDVNTVYVISDGKRLPIFSGEIFHDMGYQWDNVMVVSEETLAIHPLGQTITGEW